MPQAQAVMKRHFTSNAHRAAEGIEMLPGVTELLAALQVWDHGLSLRELVCTFTTSGND
jgi:hypothetical protein